MFEVDCEKVAVKSWFSSAYKCNEQIQVVTTGNSTNVMLTNSFRTKLYGKTGNLSNTVKHKSVYNRWFQHVMFCLMVVYYDVTLTQSDLRIYLKTPN